MTKGDQIDDREREYLISCLAETESTFFYEEKEKGFFQEEYVVKGKRSDFDRNIHTRKYLGVVLQIGQYNYYVPMSSPKDSDYQIAGANKVIKKSIVPIIGIVVKKFCW